MFKRECPRCGKILVCKQIGNFNRSNRKKTCCKKCSDELRSLKRPDYLINKKTGCWEWVKDITWGGYGSKNGRGAHRVYYERYKGEIPKGLEIDHLCRNRKCVNPEHLEAVTKAVNQRRGLMSKLKEEQVLEIRKIGGTMTQRGLAKKFNVSQRLIFNILHNLTWKNI